MPIVRQGVHSITGRAPMFAWMGLIVGLLVPASMVRAEEPEAAGRFVSVPSSLGGDVVSRLLQTTEAEFSRFKAANRNLPVQQQQVFKIVLDFNPDGKAANSNDYEDCLKLANGIRKLQQDGASTTAYVHGEVSRHSVLPVLACQQLVMSKKAKIGPVVRDGTAATPDVKAAYQRLAVRLSENPDIVAKLFERDMAIFPSKNRGWVDGNKVNEVGTGRPLFESGEPAVFDFAKAKQVRLCENDPQESRDDLAEAFRMPRSTLQESPLVERVVAWKITLGGEVKRSTQEQVERRVRRAIANNANLIILELRCHGGDVAVATSIGKYLVKLNDDRKDRPVVTVAFLTPDADNTATCIALGCNYIVMDSQKDGEGKYLATLGGFGKLLGGGPAAELKSVGEGLEELARLRHYPPLLVRGFVFRDGEELFYVKSAKGAREWKIMTGRMLDDERQQRPGHWVEPATPIPLDERGFVRLRADDPANAEVKDTVPTALNMGLALKTCTLEELYADYGLTTSQVKEIAGDWLGVFLDDLANLIREEPVWWLLISLAITFLFMELKMPGVGVPGILAAVCFILLFWAGTKEMSGQASWLAILLFLLGLVLVSIELFILPGFGLPGITGIMLILGSIALITYGKWPQDSVEWVSLSKKLAPLGLSLMASVVFVILLARYLPSIPYFNRLLLKPQDEKGEETVEEFDPAQARLAALLGAIGVAATPLRPAGKVQFGEEYIDVVAEGSYVSPGTRVQVIEIEGNRVVVKSV